MYIPNNIKTDDIKVAHQLIDEFGFGLLVSSVSDALTGTHLPMVLHANEGECGVLYGHFAKANPHWKDLEGKHVLMVFSGPHHYISPSWYAHAPAVPTWNYAAVHAMGKLNLLDAKQTIAVVEELVGQYEPELLAHQDIISHEYRDKLLSGIVGFKVALTSLQCKQKLGQQRALEDQAGVYNALRKAANPQALGLADYMKQQGLGLGE